MALMTPLTILANGQKTGFSSTESMSFPWLFKAVSTTQ
jgi:hypothetical protein